MKKYDYIIIGSGVAGLYSAINIPSNKSVLLISKDKLKFCNSYYAQGGVAFSIDNDDINCHIKDTLEAGAFKNSKDSVAVLTKNSQDILKDLIELGFEFDKDKNGELLFTKEAAHSVSRILHANGDATGKALHKFLVNIVKERKNIEILTFASVVDLLIDNNICYGITLYKDKVFENYYSNNTLIASGGIGELFKYHTNSKSITADLQGICISYGIKLKDMHFLQFHPTVYVDSENKLLLTEALRGEGASVVDENGKRFLFDYHKDGELAPRSVVSQAIFNYKKSTNLDVYLSFDNFKKKFFRKRFPNIYKNFKKLNFVLPKDKIPISPAFHYCMGGIDVDLNSKVKGFQNLYAVGEVACNGVHGANRLASNSLLETFVFSKICVNNSLKNDIKDVRYFARPNFKLKKTGDKKLIKELKDIMWNNVGIIRKNEDLKESLKKISKMLNLDIGLNLKLRLLTARNIIISAIDNDSIGAHYKI